MTKPKRTYAVRVERARAYLKRVHKMTVPRARSGAVVLAAARVGRLQEKFEELHQRTGGWSIDRMGTITFNRSAPK